MTSDQAVQSPIDSNLELDHDESKTPSDDSRTIASSEEVAVTEKSRGVERMEILVSRLNNKYKFVLYGLFTLLAYCMSLDQYTSSTYLTTATSVSFEAHSTLATIRVIKSVFQSVSQPPVAKFADVVGRVEAYIFCVFMYVIGYIIAASASSITVYAVGNSIYIIGITGLFLLQNIIIGDMSSLRNRLFWSIFPSLPGVINVWVSGNIAQGILDKASWRWGLGIHIILTPVLAAPIIAVLAYGMRGYKPAIRRKLSIRRSLRSTYWQLDVVGLLLLVGSAGMVLVIITLANSNKSKWSDAHSIGLLVGGGVAGILFVLWERYQAKHPIIPFTLLKNRTVIAAFLIAVLHPAAGSVANGYFYTFLVVASGQSVTSATRLSSLVGFTSTITAVVAGLITRYTRRLKPLIIFGFCVQILGLGLMIRFRQATNSQGEIGMVQVVRGIGSGCIGFPVQAAIQAASGHEHLAAITAAYLTVYYLAGGVGAAIGGGIWTNLVPKKLATYLSTDPALAESAYANPIGFAKQYALGTGPRDALARAQDETQRTMVIVATAIAAAGLIVAFAIENVRLPDSQSLDEKDNVVTVEARRRRQSRGSSCLKTKKRERRAMK